MRSNFYVKFGGIAKKQRCKDITSDGAHMWPTTLRDMENFLHLEIPLPETLGENHQASAIEKKNYNFVKNRKPPMKQPN